MPGSSRDMNFPVLATLGVTAVLLVFVIVVAAQAWFRYQFDAEYARKVIYHPDRTLVTLKKRQKAHLHAPKAAVPIDQAMQQVMQRYQKQRQERNQTQGNPQSKEQNKKQQADNGESPVEVASQGETEASSKFRSPK